MSRSRVLFTLCLAVLIAQLDTSVVNLAMRRIGTDLGAGVSTLQWVMDAYNLAYASLLLTGGTLGDLYGRRRLFVLGILAFAAGSVVCGVAPGAAVLIAGRALTGLGAALALPTSLAIIADVYRDGTERARAIGVWASCNGVALAIGPSIGGLLMDWTGWRGIFLVVVPVALLAVVLALRCVPESASPEGRHLDAKGQALAVLGLTLLAVAVIEGPRWTWTAWPTLGCGGASVAALLGFVHVERRGASPMVPLALFRSAPFSAALVVASMMTFSTYAMLFLLPIALQSAHGLGVRVAGLAMLPMALAFVVVSRNSGTLVGRFGARATLAAGMACMAAGALAMSVAGSATPAIWLVAASLLSGVGLGLAGGPVMAVAVARVPADRAGTASGLGNTARMLGATLGVAVLGAVFAGHAGTATADPAAIVAGFRAAMRGSAAAASLGAVLALAFIGRDGHLATDRIRAASSGRAGAVLREIGWYLADSPRSRGRQRELLRAMDDRMLRDIGLTRYDAMQAADRDQTLAPSIRSPSRSQVLPFQRII